LDWLEISDINVIVLHWPYITYNYPVPGTPNEAQNLLANA